MQISKLYRYYFGKIWRKNWLRIIIFTVLIGVVWWFVVPWGISKAAKTAIKIENKEDFEKATDQQIEFFEKEFNFSNLSKMNFGKWGIDKFRRLERKRIENDIEKLKQGEAKDWKFEEKLDLWNRRARDSGDFVLISTPWSADNAFFFSQTDGYNKMGEKSFWKMLFDISWWSLSGFVILYWLIFEILDKTFFKPQKDGEETVVLTTTPGVKRSDVIWAKILAFLSFYCLINIALFLIPFGIYYWWLASVKNFAWFALLALITCLVGPILFFGLVFAPYLFFSSLFKGAKWFFSALFTFSPFIWGGIKLFTSASWPYTVEEVFFDPVWFIVISLVSGIFFLTLYYLRYQEEDLG